MSQKLIRFTPVTMAKGSTITLVPAGSIKPKPGAWPTITLQPGDLSQKRTN